MKKFNVKVNTTKKGLTRDSINKVMKIMKENKNGYMIIFDVKK